MARLALVLLFAASALLSGADARSGRGLAQTDTCPIENCLTSAQACRYVQRSGLWQCTLCKAPFKPNTALSACVCPAGTYVNSAGTCVTCDKDFFCPQGQDPTVSTKTACPRNMVTLKPGAKSNGACVNKPGYRFVRTSSGPSAVACRKDEYCAGLTKQASCEKCPPNFATDIRNPPGSHTSSAVCVAPPGYQISGDTVAPCAKGEFKEDYSTADSCTRCEAKFGPGITTAGQASTSAADCNQLAPGYALVNEKGKVILQALGAGTDENAKAFTKAKLCPQNWICPGGDPTLPITSTNSGTPYVCPSGMWTEEEGASEPSVCRVPPGYRLTSSSTTISECPNGEYREGFVAPEEAANCKPCGQSSGSGPTAKWLSERNVNIFSLDQDTGAVFRQIPVRGSENSCYIQRGMGSVMVKSGNGTYVLRAMFCPASFYGISAAKKNGLTATPCLACPPNMGTSGAPDTFRAIKFLDGITDTSTADTPTGTSFFDISACQTLPGYGYAAGAAQECAKGYWAAGGDTKPCTKCPFGTTTKPKSIAGYSVATDNNDPTDCKYIIEGYGWDALNQRYQLCPADTYQAVPTADFTSPPACTKCSNAFTRTPDVGSTSADNCTLCADGYGAPKTGMACTSCKDGLYGPAIRTTTPCLVCPVDRTYTFAWDQGADVFTPKPTSRDGASTLDDCIADFAQAEDGAFYLDITGGALAAAPQYLLVPRINSLDSCVSECRLNSLCVAVTFNYATLACYHWSPLPTVDWSKGGLAMKTFSSSRLAQSIAKGAGTGQWTYWKTDARDVLDAFITSEEKFSQSIVVGTGAATLDACQTLCTEDRLCAGIVFGPATGGPNSGAGDPIAIGTVGASNAWATDVNQYNPVNGGATYAAACYLLKGVVEPASPKRTLVRALASNFDQRYCPPSTYRNAATSGICTACAAGTGATDITLSTVSNADTCPKAADTCTSPWRTTSGKQYACGCAAGKALAADKTCQDCTAGTWSEPDNTLSGCRAPTECPPGYVINDDKKGCKKCPKDHVPNADQTACGCLGPNKMVDSATSGTCKDCPLGTSWPADLVNPSATTCNPCGDGIQPNSAANNKCDQLLAGWYFRASDKTIRKCRVGYFCPGFGGTIGTQTSGTVVAIVKANNLDQGIFKCPNGTTTRETVPTDANTAVTDCDSLLPGYMFCPTAATPSIVGYNTHTCGTGKTFTAADSFAAIIKCIKGGYCAGGDFKPGATTPSVEGFTACDADATIDDGYWSKASSTSVADCNLVSPKYYWSGTKPVLCPAASYCPGGLPANKDTPFGIYTCSACTASGIASACDCAKSGTDSYTGSNGDGTPCKLPCT